MARRASTRKEPDLSCWEGERGTERSRAGSADPQSSQSYFRRCFFISLVRRIERSRWKVVRDGNAPGVFALSAGVYLRGDSQPFVAGRRKGNRRRYSYSCSLLSSCRAIPDAAGNRHFRIARHSREIYLQFSLVARSSSIPRLEAAHDPRREIERREYRDEFEILDIKVSAIPEDACPLI